MHSVKCWDNLHNELRRIRSRPKQAQIIAEYLLYVADYVVEINSPEKQLGRLHEIFADMKKTGASQNPRRV